MYYINTLKQELGTAKTYQHNVLDERLVSAIWLQRLLRLLMTIIASSLRYTGCLNAIKYPISHVLCLILVDTKTTELSILLTSCLNAI